MLTESTPNFIIREVGVYFLIVALLTCIGSLIDRLLPAAHLIVFVAFFVIVAIWTFLSIVALIDVTKRRKARRLPDSDII